jgi:glycosyltransferase involved in cell wall biosynthesis
MFIRQAIEGVLMQQCAFEVEFIISNDCSPDGTDAVIRNTINAHPNGSWVNYIKHKKNLGMMPNFLDTLQKAQGKYIALCEGDDYWTDPLKLQKQVDFLEINKEYSIHSGKAEIIKDGVIEELIGDPLAKQDYILSDFFTQNNLISCTVLFRNTPLLQRHFKKIVFGDWMLYVQIISQNTNTMAYVSSDIYANYRLHQGGIMQTLVTLEDHFMTQLKQIQAIQKCIKFHYTTDDVDKIDTYCLHLFKYYFRRKEYTKAISYGFKNLILIKKLRRIRVYLSFIKRHFKRNHDAK